MSLQLKIIYTNTLAQLTAKVVTALLTLLTTFYFLRLAGPELFGLYSQALALITIGFTTIDFGLNAHAVRQMQGSLTRQRDTLADVILARLLLSLLAVLATNFIVQLLPGGYSGPLRRLFWLGSLALVFQGLFTSVNAWFQRRLTLAKSALITVLGTAFGTALTLYFLFTNPSLGPLLFAFTAGYILMGVLALRLARVGSLSLNPPSSLRLLRGSTTLGLLLVLSVVVNKLDVIVLGSLLSPASVGEYSLAYRIFDVALTLPIFVMNAVYPLLISGSSARLLAAAARRLLALGIIGGLTLALAAPLLFFIRPDLTLSVTVLRLLSLFLPLFYLTAPLMWDLIARRLERYLLVVYSLAAVFNLVLNLVFVPRYFAPAAAIITGLTELGIFLGLLYIKHRHVQS